MNEPDNKNRTLSIEKMLDAPVRVTWEAWTNPNHVIQWWSPPGMPLEILEHTFKVGGKWKYSATMPDGNKFVSEGTYLVIEPFKKIVTSADFRPMTEGVELQVLFEEIGGKTKLTFSVVHKTEDYARQQEKMGFYNGWGSAFKRLESLIANKLLR